MLILGLFLIFLYFGLLCLSGGSSLLQFFIDELVVKRQWLTLDELGNLMAVSQVTPGPIGVNIATFIGYQHGGFWGGLAATVGLLLPSFFLMSLAIKSYQHWQESRIVRGVMHGLKPATTALIITAFAAGLGMSVFTTPLPLDQWLRGGAGNSDFALRPLTLPIFAFAFYALRTKKLSIMSVIFISAVAGAVLSLLG